MRLLARIGILPFCTLSLNKTVDTQMDMLIDLTSSEFEIRKAFHTLNINKVAIVTLHNLAHKIG